MRENNINVANAILDIHTHKGEIQSGGKAIINYRQSAGTPLQDGYYYSVGIHPWELKPGNLKRHSDFVIDHLPDEHIVAIGECGLDKLKGASINEQMVALQFEIFMSLEYDLPLILHNVRMTDKILAVKKNFNPSRLGYGMVSGESPNRRNKCWTKDCICLSENFIRMKR